MNETTIVWESITKMLIPISSTICLGGSIVLFLRSENIRSRRLLAFIMMMWGVAYSVIITGILSGTIDRVKTSFLSPSILILGNLYVIITMCYPMEVLRPGWLNLKRFLVLISPYAVTVGIYYAAILILGESPVILKNKDDFFHHATQFNVWYRLIILFSVTGYIILQLFIVYRYEVSYRRWCENNYASPETLKVSWLYYFGIGCILISFAYFFVVFDGNAYCYAIHNMVIQAFFAFTLYKGLFHQNAYTENFFRHTMNEEKAHEKELDTLSKTFSVGEHPVTNVNESENEMNDTTFLTRLPSYLKQVQQWMEETKPYLRKDFQLMDVSEQFALNRTYLSRLFNEGWGMSFSNVVSEYRIRHAEKLLKNRPDLTISQISSQCGFTSPSTFHRTFSKHHGGVTPKQYLDGYLKISEG